MTPAILLAEPTREEWLARKEQGISSTEIASVLGLNPYESQLDLWLRKTKQIPAREGNLRMEVGLYMEPIIAQLYDRKKGVHLKEYPGKLAVHPKAEWAIASPDRLVVGHERIVECKMVGERMADQWGEEDTDEVPDYYLLQVQWQMLVTGIKEADFSCLIGNNKHATYHVDAHGELQQTAFAAADKFWHEFVLPKKMPPTDFTTVEPDMMAKIFKHTSDLMVKADAETENIVHQLRDALTAQGIAEEQAEQFKNLIKAKIGNAAGIEGDGWSATWKKNKDSAKVNWEAVAQELQAPKDLIRKYTTIKEGPRKFLPKFGKEEK